MAKRRQRRRREKEQRHGTRPAGAAELEHRELAAPVQPLAYTREQAAQALGVSLATLDRRVLPVISTVKTEWGARLIPLGELERYLVERREEPRGGPRRSTRSGRKSAVPLDVVMRVRHEHERGVSVAEIARRLNRDEIPTGQGGRQWWPSTVRDVLLRSSLRSAAGSPP